VHDGLEAWAIGSGGKGAMAGDGGGATSLGTPLLLAELSTASAIHRGRLTGLASLVAEGLAMNAAVHPGD